MLQAQRIRKEIGVPKDAFLIVSVGELNKNKNHQVIVKAVAKIQNKSIHYVIAGKGDQKKILEQLSLELKIDEQVHLIGYQEDISLLYHAADLCAFPSIREGLGLAALEGMTCGLPLICSNNRGSKSYATNDNAIMCNADSPKDFAKAIITLINNPELCSKMGKNGKKTTEEYSIDYVNELMKKIYFKYL